MTNSDLGQLAIFNVFVSILITIALTGYQAGIDVIPTSTDTESILTSTLFSNYNNSADHLDAGLCNPDDEDCTSTLLNFGS